MGCPNIQRWMVVSLRQCWLVSKGLTQGEVKGSTQTVCYSGWAQVGVKGHNPNSLVGEVGSVWHVD